MIQLHIRVLLRQLNHRLAPQHAVGQHVGLVNARHMLAAQPRRLECHVTDALDLALLINHRVDHFDVAIWQRRTALGLAKVQPPRQLAHAQHVESAFHQVCPHG